MANIKNFGIVGVGSGVQFGKGGSQLIQTSGTFAAMNAQGNAFVRFSIADATGNNDAISFQQLSNAAAAINSNVATVASELSNAVTGAGLNNDGTYTAPTGTNFLDNATSLANATTLLDAAIAAEVARAEGAESTLSNAITSAVSNAAALQGEVDQIENSVGLGPDGTLTLTAGNYLGNAISVVSAVEILDSVLGNTNVALEANAALISGINANVASLASDVANTDANVATMSSQLFADEANIAALQTSVSGIDSDISNVVANVATLQTNAAADEANIAALQTSVSDNTANIATLQTNQVADEANIAALQTSVSADESNIAALQTGLSNVVSNVATIQSSQAADEANIAVLQGTVANNVSNISALQAQVAADEANSTNLAGTVANNTANIATLQTEFTSLSEEVSNIESDYLALAGGTMEGALSLGGFQINDLGAPTAPTDAATKGYVDNSVAALAGAFIYQGTVAPGTDAGNATLLAANAVAGWYYKATNDGYVIGADANSVAFEVFNQDGIVRNTANSWDVIGHVEYTVQAADSSITVSGSPDTGYQINVSAAYTATIEGDIANAAAAAVANTDALANAIAAETSRAEAAEGVLTNAVVLVNANVATLSAQVSSDEANASALSNSVSALANTVGVIQTAQIADEANIAALQSSIGSEAANIVALQEGLSNTNANVATLTAQVVSDEANASALANTVADNTANISVLQTQVASDEANATALTATVANNTANIATLQSNQVADESNIAALQTSVAGIEANASALVGTVANNTANIATLQTNAAADEANIAALQTGLSSTDANVAALANTVAEGFVGAGLNVDGSYAANAGSTYIANATSLADADNMLDNAVAALAEELATLSQDEIKTNDGLNYVLVQNDAITTALNVNNVATPVISTIGGANTNTLLTFDFSSSNTISLAATGTANTAVDLRLSGQDGGSVIIGETGVGVIQADTGYDMTVAGGAGANLNLLGETVIVGEADGTPVAEFTGTAGATAYTTLVNGNTSTTIGTAGSASNIDLVFAPKGTGMVNVSGTKIINVANATNSGDAVNYGQLQTAVATAQTGVVTTVMATLPATSGSVNLGTVNGTILRVSVMINTAFDNGSTVTVGNSSTANDLTAASDVDESTAGLYVVDVLKPYSSTMVTATVTNATGLNGSATVIVEYLQA